MGYYIKMTKADYVIPTENAIAAFEAVRALSARELTFVESDVLENTRNIVQALNECRYEVAMEDDGVHIDAFLGEKFGDDVVLFGVLAPFAKDGSYVQFLGEDGDQWKYASENGKLVMYEATFTWTPVALDPVIREIPVLEGL